MHLFGASTAIIMVGLIPILQFDYAVAAVTKLTNLQCESLDPNIVTFAECKLNVIGRDVINLNTYAKILKLPLNKFEIDMGLYQKANGYKPFLYNSTVDYCQFARKSVRNVFLMIGMNAVKSFTNLNHSCPIDHDLQVKNFMFSEDMFRLLPLPSGEYLLHLLFRAADKWQASVKVYATRKE